MRDENSVPKHCPKCGSDFEGIEYGGVQVDRCTSCRGLWFDLLEHEDLARIQGADSIDIGDEEVGRNFDLQRRIDCPVCNSQMIAMVDRKQANIHYEACTTCYGVFFDAGEFRDYAERSVLDFFRDLISRDRD